MISRNKASLQKHYFLTFSLLSCILMITSPKCTDKPECFRKLMFNFKFPQMNVFEIKSTTQQTQQYMMKAYGDFNNDLFSDFIAVNQQNQFLVFVWNNNLYFYEKVFTKKLQNTIIPKTLYLVDVSGDGRQDIIVWGEQRDEQSLQVIENRLIAFVREDLKTQQEDKVSYDFKQNAKITCNPTTDPIVIGHRFVSSAQGVGFLMVLNSTRQFVKFVHLPNVDPVFEMVEWKSLVIDGQAFSGIQFLNPHWNSFVDLTGDCRPDMIILNEKQEIQVWVAEGDKFKLNKIINITNSLGNQIMSMTFSDINYDGAMDLLIAFETEIKIYTNPHSLTIDDKFCISKNQNVVFSNSPITVTLPSSHKIKRQSLHLGDINIDGYPDLFLVMTDTVNEIQIPIIYENQFDLTDGSFYPFQKPNFNNGALPSISTKNGQILSVSFIDILENGYVIFQACRILDIIITYESDGKYITRTFYNNYLYQNDYFIKGYGLLGPTITYGSQYPGMSFYWLNSVNDGFKISYSAQIIQSAYDSLQLPYAFSGLGRTNNYVESFTIGRNGLPQQWSPIIPNSQLGVFTTHQQSDEWKIRIFSFPLYELIAVIICTAVILSVFGVYLMYRKCKGYGKKQEPLEIQFIS